MSTLDIRRMTEGRIKAIVFADRDTAGTGKAVRLEEQFPDQVAIVTQGNDNIHVKYKDVDNLIAALKKAKELWQGK